MEKENAWKPSMFPWVSTSSPYRSPRMSSGMFDG